MYTLTECRDGLISQYTVMMPEMRVELSIDNFSELSDPQIYCAISSYDYLCACKTRSPYKLIVENNSAVQAKIQVCTSYINKVREIKSFFRGLRSLQRPGHQFQVIGSISSVRTERES